MSEARDRVNAALEAVRARNPDGRLVPAEVVDAARAEGSPLHSYFEWDDSKAAAQHRLYQARYLIRAYVVVSPATNKPVRAMVSVMSDRVTGAGYRPIDAVLSAKELRAQVVAEALAKYERLRREYEHLTELSSIHEAIEATQEQAKKGQKRKRRTA